MLLACRGDAVAQATRLDALSSEGMPSGFALATEPKPFVFPRDHGPHPDFRHEWWYVTGHLDAQSGERFGFELTFFRFALVPPRSGDVSDTRAGAATKNDRNQSRERGGAHSAWRARQIYMAHFAVTDLDRGTFHASERYARDALGLAGAQAEPFRVWLDSWSLGTPASETGPEGSSYWQLRAADQGYAFDLQLRAVTPPVLNGDAGLSRKSDAPGAASFYYSIPRLAATGRIVRDGKPLDVNGLAWLDREWGSGALGADQQGWDWFALQFDDGGTLMFYALRKRDGGRDSHSAGTWFAPDGTTHALSSDDVQIDVKDYWNSPRGGRYPARWQLRVPSLRLNVEVRPRLADQELDTSPRYWEGAASIAGTRGDSKIAGRAYVELVGYAN
jgi:predicted secreted hydrolase